MEFKKSYELVLKNTLRFSFSLIFISVFIFCSSNGNQESLDTKINDEINSVIIDAIPLKEGYYQSIIPVTDAEFGYLGAIDSLIESDEKDEFWNDSRSLISHNIHINKTVINYFEKKINIIDYPPTLPCDATIIRICFQGFNREKNKAIFRIVSDVSECKGKLGSKIKETIDDVYLLHKNKMEKWEIYTINSSHSKY